MKFGGRDFDLARIPHDPDLQAFDQADLYALDNLPSEGTVLLVLDAFGALACALSERDRASTGDSEISRLAMAANLERNDLVPCNWTDLDSIDGEFDTAIVKVPRQKALLDAALARVRPGVFHSQGGLLVDEDARVLRPDGSPVPNLFAGGGAAVGISGRDGGAGYASGNGLLTALGLGWLAARAAAREIAAGG